MEKRLVYAEDALANIEREKAYLTDVGYIHAKSAVNSAPTVDAKPVVHGRWIAGTGSWSTRRCSVCNWKIPYDWYVDLDKHFNYCPNCGADMRGDRDA